jgi:hypothetical protein
MSDSPWPHRTTTQSALESAATVMEISGSVYHVSSEGSSYLRGMKCALSILGYCRNVMAQPYEPYGPAELEGIRAALVKDGLLAEPVLAGKKRVL